VELVTILTNSGTILIFIRLRDISICYKDIGYWLGVIDFTNSKISNKIFLIWTEYC